MNTIYLTVAILAAIALGALTGWLLARTVHNVFAVDQEREACAQVADEATDWAETLLSADPRPDIRALGFQQGCKYASKTIAGVIRNRRPAL